jgi:hypothetical protein
MRISLGAILVCSLFHPAALHAQEAQTDDRTNALRLFLDCPAECDEDFFREEIAIIDYVRDRLDADVHVLITSQATGGGGTEYTLQFIGVNRFTGSDQTLRYAASQTSTEDERRTGLAETLKRGLVRYIAETPLADRITITFAPRLAAVQADQVQDPWNLWVFSARFGGTVNGESSNKGRSIRVGASAGRTTDEWRLAFSTSADYRDDVFELSDDQAFESVSKTFSSAASAVKSLTSHWSAGVVADASSSTFLNYNLRARLASGVEFNVFPYSESTQRMLTTQYTVGINSLDYREETIFGHTSERHIDHRLATTFTMLQPWGSGSASVSFAQFLTRPDKYSVSAFGTTNVRLFRGFSFNTFASISRTLDQIYLPKGDATVQEILVRQRQLATSYRYAVNFGITYSFGSIFNNIVNPRFGGRGEDSPD